MRLPKTVNICGKTYGVVRKVDKTGCNGSGNTRNQKIIVGSHNHSDEKVFNTFLHEVIELATCESHFRYEASNEDIIFMMTHKEFDSLVDDVAVAIRPMLR